MEMRKITKEIKLIGSNATYDKWYHDGCTEECGVLVDKYFTCRGFTGAINWLLVTMLYAYNYLLVTCRPDSQIVKC